MTEDRNLFLVITKWSPPYDLEGSVRMGLVSCPKIVPDAPEIIRRKLAKGRARYDKLNIIPVVGLEHLDEDTLQSVFTVSSDGDGDIRSW